MEYQLIARLCKHRYGKLNATLLKQLERLSLKQLDKLALLLMDNPEQFDLEKFKAWMQSQLTH